MYQLSLFTCMLEYQPSYLQNRGERQSKYLAGRIRFFLRKGLSAILIFRQRVAVATVGRVQYRPASAVGEQPAGRRCRQRYEQPLRADTRGDDAHLGEQPQQLRGRRRP